MTDKTLPDNFKITARMIRHLQDSLCNDALDNCKFTECEHCMLDADPKEFKEWLIKELSND